jgi:Flp pilus assembly protein TadG
MRPQPRRRRGIILMLSAFLMVFLLGVIAFAVDIGYIAHVKTDLQRATDAAAFAGAGALINGTSAAEIEAVSYLGQNKVGGTTLGASNATVQFGIWSGTSRTFTVSASQPNAIRVSATASQQPFFFGKVFGKSDFAMSGASVATYQPRDISLVLDYSGSMCYDSQFRNISLLGQSAVEANLLQIYQDLGSPVYGTLTFTPQTWGGSSTTTTSIKSKFGLTNVAYPYPDGSWNEYIDYVKTDSYVNAAGYRYKYGYMTWLNYVMAKEGSAADAPGFHVTHQQPVTALKDAVDVFLSYLQAHSTDDQVSVSIYTASDGTAKLENTLTKVYSTISNIVRNRQAGHYTSGTNISAGMTKGRVDLQNNARPGAKKIMIVMTDGVVNLPTGSTSTDKAKVITEANLCAAANIPIVTIALGAYADTALMQQVADITGGACFIVPGGQPIAQVQAQLEQVFVQVASDRPLRLVQ